MTTLQTKSTALINAINSLVKSIQEYHSDTFNGSHLTEEEASSIAANLIYNHLFLPNGTPMNIDGVELAELYEQIKA